ncbi:hypothetical protein [Microcoleus sp. herbarium13]|uniref:hypothetical protein n=1 Tax=Microcoleus sp. herbarium13 TaxID=3055438 RepID=UPI002FCFD099
MLTASNFYADRALAKLAEEDRILFWHQLISCTIFNKFFMDEQDAHPAIKFSLCGTGILPVL